MANVLDEIFAFFTEIRSIKSHSKISDLPFSIHSLGGRMASTISSCFGLLSLSMGARFPLFLTNHMKRFSTFEIHRRRTLSSKL